jgi:hypothetical protein
MSAAADTKTTTFVGSVADSSKTGEASKDGEASSDPLGEMKTEVKQLREESPSTPHCASDASASRRAASHLLSLAQELSREQTARFMAEEQLEQLQKEAGRIKDSQAKVDAVALPSLLWIPPPWITRWD